MAGAELYAYTNQLAKDRAVNPRDDIVTKLINAEIDGDRLTELEFDIVHAPAHRGRQRDHPQRHPPKGCWRSWTTPSSSTSSRTPPTG